MPDEDRIHCIDCGVAAPPTETNYTLISSRHGWRSVRVIDQDGRKMLEWRCPSCWPHYRQKSVPPHKG